MQLLREGKEAFGPWCFVPEALMRIGGVADVVGSDAEGEEW